MPLPSQGRGSTGDSAARLPQRESRSIALKNIIRGINRQFPIVGLPKPSQSLARFGLKPYFDAALDSLGVREYSSVRFPVNGSSFMLTVRSQEFWRLIERRGFEPNCIEHLSKEVAEGSRIMDVGAGFGAYSLLFSRLAGDGGEVHAFEPDPVCKGILQDNVRRNRTSNVRVHDLCVSSTPGTTVLRSALWGTGTSTIVKRALPGASLERVVGVTTIDDFCHDSDLRPHGLKIDVEGAEGLVLSGARKTIKDCSPWILLEFHGYFMTPEERESTWLLATRSAKNVVFLDGDSRVHSPGDELDALPDCPSFHVFIEH